MCAARALTDEGFDIALVDLHDTADDVVVSSADRGAAVRYYRLDIADLSRHDEVLGAIANDFGRLDRLVDNAGIAARPLTDILELSPEAFDRSVDVNLRGTFFLTQAFANRLIADGAYHSIIVVSSIAAALVSTERTQYNVTRSALSMVAKFFAVRLAEHGIHVHEVRPGLIATAMAASPGNTIADDWITGGRVPPRPVGTEGGRRYGGRDARLAPAAVHDRPARVGVRRHRDPPGALTTRTPRNPGIPLPEHLWQRTTSMTTYETVDVETTDVETADVETLIADDRSTLLQLESVGRR